MAQTVYGQPIKLNKQKGRLLVVDKSRPRSVMLERADYSALPRTELT